MLEALQNGLARALYHPDSDKKLEELSASADLSAEERKLLTQVRGRGVRLTHLLLMNLRFERVLRGCPALEAWFETEPANFVKALREYHRMVPPNVLFANQEAVGFQAFLEQRFPDKFSSSSE